MNYISAADSSTTQIHRDSRWSSHQFLASSNMLAMVSIGKHDSMDAATDVPLKLEATHLQSTSSAPPSRKQPVGFTTLPAPVRNKIHSHLLDTELVNAGQPNVSYTHTIKKSTLHFNASRPPFPVASALFFVNKQISKEARDFFYSKNLFIKFEIYSPDARHAKTMLEDSGVLFSVASPEAVEKCTTHAMDLTIVEKGSAVKRTSVIFPAQYLPRLVNFMEQASKASGAWAAGHALFLSVVNMFGLEKARVQGDLLELFRSLTDIGKVEVDGKELLEGYAYALQRSMMAATFEADVWLKAVTEMTDRAEAAHDKSDYETATQQCQAATISITYAYLTRAETLHSQPESFVKSLQHLRWRTELTLATTLHAKHSPTIASSSPLISASTPTAAQKQIAADLLAAETAASHALSLSTDSPSPASNPWFRSLPPELIPPNKPDWFTDAERGRSWYVLGLTHMALGECLFAAGDLERAAGLLRDNEDADKAFAQARNEINWEVRPGVGLRKAAWVARRETE
ncbi:uncharacterized protein N0V89_004303 [Didymosphaeria variabile]|uniref:Uncharacterized protein n=1 Tax=Didymosphaeria variabile TaxID=1932322 RepID=A0A9W8XQ66_9PLEO|nr:uncharacterized protein N0V89_004303 [Didymosphaeria variabile]KAJ4356272.1 hypothetical protein N0V89_004303 [Didymosphaeria variabile]